MIVFSKCKNAETSGEPFKRWCEFHGIVMSHMKKTCPNPHSGEKYYSNPIGGILIDVVNRHGFFVTDDEYETMMQFTSKYVELEFRNLIFSSNIMVDYRGAIAAKKFSV